MIRRWFKLRFSEAVIQEFRGQLHRNFGAVTASLFTGVFRRYDDPG